MRTSSIPGYRLGDTTLPKSPLTKDDLATLKTTLLFGDEDVAALRQAHSVVEDQVEAILDVWYGFVGSTPHLLEYFSDAQTHQTIGAYLDAVRKSFGQWILDTCRADYDEAWLAWQDEIGRRHHRSGKNRTDGVSAAPHIPMRFVLPLAMPISITMTQFLAKKGHTSAEVEAMHAAWSKAVLLQAILWSRPYASEGDFWRSRARRRTGRSNIGSMRRRRLLSFAARSCSRWRSKCCVPVTSDTACRKRSGRATRSPRTISP